jgi:hypothetical protein
MKESFKVVYKDIPILLVVIPIVTLLSYYLTYAEFKFDSFFFTHFPLDLIEAYAGAFAGRTIIVYLDSLYPFSINIFRRILLQIKLSAIFVLTSITLLNELFRMVLLREEIPQSYYTHNLLIFFIWVLAFNGFYVCVYFYQYYQFLQKHNVRILQEKSITQPQNLLGNTQSAKQKVENFPLEMVQTKTENQESKIENKQKKLLTRIGRQEILIDAHQILCFSVEEEIVWAFTDDQKRYPIDYSLDKLEEMLDPAIFFRANRQIIIHLDMVKSITKGENGKLQVMLRHYKNLPAVINISRTKAPAFKQWTKQSVLHFADSSLTSDG